MAGYDKKIGNRRTERFPVFVAVIKKNKRYRVSQPVGNNFPLEVIN